MIESSGIHRRLRFRTRVLMLPLLAAVSYALIFVINGYLGAQNAAVLASIESGYVPEVALSNELRRTIENIQRTLQDAVAAEDMDAIVRADAMHSRFDQMLATGRQLPIASAAGYDELERLSTRFYSLARATTEHLVRRDASSSLSGDLAAVAQSSAELVARLEANVARDKAQSAAAFDRAARLQERARWLSGLAILGCFVLLVLSSIWTVRSVVGPVQALTAVAARIASEGDLAQEVPDMGDDEVGQLAHSFRAVLERLRIVPVSLQVSAAQLKSAVLGLNQVSGQQSDSAREQIMALTGASAGTQELRQGATAAAADAQRVLQVAGRAELVSVEGQASVESSLRGLAEIRDRIDAIVASIAALSEHTQRIGGVLDGVKDLAEQSNMLALNAAIVAMKSGEQGRNFAVIAREMRRLSDQSGQSMGESLQILDRIQGAIRSTVKLTDRGAQKIELSIREIRASGETLRKVTDFVDETSQAARHIASTVAQQAAAVEEISRVVLGLHQQALETQQGIAEMQSAIGKVDATSEAIVSVVESFRV
jgi:methyl-accepting chemotaxis protein